MAATAGRRPACKLPAKPTVCTPSTKSPPDDSVDESDIFVDICEEPETISSPPKKAKKSTSRSSKQRQKDARHLQSALAEECTPPLPDETILETPAPPTPPQPTANELQEGWAAASTFLRRRLLDPRSTAAASMPLRSSLEEAAEADAMTFSLPELQITGKCAQTRSRLHSLLLETAMGRQPSISVLLIGPRGVGKTLVLERVLAGLEQECNAGSDLPAVATVRLSGLVHADERTAFQDIARQLCGAFKCQFVKSASLAENQAFLRTMLKELARGMKAVVFVLDELDLFAAKARQTLLYNLLDALQAADMQAAVVGTSCRLDVLELLEKRVASRMSCRKELILEPGQTSDPADSAAPSQLLQAMLSVPPGLHAPSYAAAHNAAVAAAVRDEALAEHLRLQSLKGGTLPRDLADLALAAVCSVPVESGMLGPDHLRAAAKHRECCNVSQAIKAWGMQALSIAGLSVLQLYLLAAALRRRQHGHDASNFTQAWEELAALRAPESGCTMDLRSRSAAVHAWARLAASGLLPCLDSRGSRSTGMPEYVMHTLALGDDEIAQGAAQHKCCPPLLMAWLGGRSREGA